MLTFETRTKARRFKALHYPGRNFGIRGDRWKWWIVSRAGKILQWDGTWR